MVNKFERILRDRHLTQEEVARDAEVREMIESEYPEQIVSAIGHIRELAPLLFVTDINSSAAFYRDKLEFRIAQVWEPDGRLAWCRLERDGAALMLQQACEEDGPADGRGRCVAFFFNCEDAAAMRAELRKRGLYVDALKIAFYGMNQFFIRDSDGYELCFQSPVDAT